MIISMSLFFLCSFLRETSKESALNAAQAYLKLGEVSLETENYERAVDDFNSCLKLQQDHLESCDRLIAETYP